MLRLQPPPAANFVVSLKNDSFLSPLPFIENGEVLPKYESCFVYGETTYHYLIESEGRVGYILKKDCEKCWAKYYCGGGCNANNVKLRGSMLKPYLIGCEMEKKRVELAIAIKAFLFKKQKLSLKK